MPAIHTHSARPRRAALIPVAAALGAALATVLALAPNPAGAAEVGTYRLQQNFSSITPGAPDLVAVDPQGSSGFLVDTVFGQTQYVYHFNGLSSPLDQQGGLSLDVTGLLPANDVYSVEIVVKFNARNSAWRRILDVANRSTDNGFYVDPGNHLNVYPVAGGSDFSNGDYHDVFLVNDHGVVSFYLDNSSATTVTTTVMNLVPDAANGNRTGFNFFLDNLLGGGTGEWSDGNVALIRVFDSALPNIPTPLPGVPEPSAAWLMALGLAPLAWRARRRSDKPHQPA